MTCESPIEEMLLHTLHKHLRDDVCLQMQVETNTICGIFRLDFLLSTDTLKIGIECDGKEFHKNRLRDEWRDAMILGANHADEIVRIDGSAIHYGVDSCVFVLSAWYPAMFTERSLTVLKSIATAQLPNESVDRILSESTDSHAFIPVVGDDGESRIHGAMMNRYFRNPPFGKREFILKFYEYALEQGGGNLDILMDRHFEEKFLQD